MCGIYSREGKPYVCIGVVGVVGAMLNFILYLSPQKKALAGVLFDYVCRRLDILEREYFGIQFEDDKKMTVRGNFVCTCVQEYTNVQALLQLVAG